jgi:FtsZ-binding cell division protein ZapB
METLRGEEIDSLAHLEERIQKAAELVSQLRRDRDTAVKEKEAAVAERDAALREAAEARAQVAGLSQELEALRGERAQVRTRIEKLLGQMDLLSSS